MVRLAQNTHTVDVNHLHVQLTTMGSKASVHASIKEISRGGSAQLVHPEKTSVQSSSKSSSSVEGSVEGAEGGSNEQIRSRKQLRELLQEKCQQITMLTVENTSLQEENQRLKAELDEIRSRGQEYMSLSHSRMSLSSGHSIRTDANSSSPWVPGSPWSFGNTLSPDVSRKSSRTDKQRRYLMPMNDIEAYGKGLSPGQAHYIVRTPSVGTKDSSEDDELNGNGCE